MLIKDVPFNPDFDPETLERAKAWLSGKEALKFAYTANFAVFSNASVSKFQGQPCHNQIRHGPMLKDRCLVATENGRGRRTSDPLSEEESEPFLRWFLYESYLGRFIVNRDDFEFCRDHGFIVSADVYTPLLQNVLITTRHFYEVGSTAFRKFNELVSQGVDGTLAYAFTMLSGYSAGIPQEGSALASYGGHRAHSVPSTLKGLCLLMRGESLPSYDKKLCDKKLFFRTNSAYEGGASLFYPVEGYYSRDNLFKKMVVDAESDFKEALKKFRSGGKGGETYTPPNPFKASRLGSATPKPDELSYKEVWDFAIPYLMEKKPWLK